MLLGAGRGHVEDPPLLLLVLDLLLLADRLELGAVHGPAAERGQADAHPPVVGDPQRLEVLAPVLAEVGHAHHGELQALRPVDGHQPHGVEVLRLQRRLALALLHQVALGHEVDEPAQVAALLGLVLARHPHQLAHVRHPPVAGGHGEHLAVVARGGHGAVDQRLQRDPRRQRALRGEPLGERRRPLRLLGLEADLRLGVGERSPRVPAPAPRLGGDQHERVQRQAAQRRGEHRVERQPVERVGQRGEVVAQVAHLLLAPVAAPAEHVGGDAALLQRALVDVHVGGGAQQQHHVGELVRAVLRELVDPLGQQPRLGGAPRRDAAHARAERVLRGVERLVPALLLLVGHQQLHARIHPRRLARACRAPRSAGRTPRPRARRR